MQKSRIFFMFAIVVALAGCHDYEADTTGSIHSGGESSNIVESPNFVTFSGGLPVGWKTYTWEIVNDRGFDDSRCLKSANYPALVFAYKTMKTPGSVQFYTQGGNIKLYIDGERKQPISSTSVGSWEQQIYVVDTGRHEFKWEADALKYLDAVTFKTN